MGSWFDNLKGFKKPDWISITPTIDEDGKAILHIKLQYNNPHIYIKEFTIDSEVSFCLKELNVQVSKGEKRGDWGGSIKCGDVLYVCKKEKRPKDKSIIRVEFT